MSYYELWLMEKQASSRVDECASWVKREHQLHQQLGRRELWLARKYHGARNALGDRLVALGERLRRSEIPQPLPLQRQMSGDNAD